MSLVASHRVLELDASYQPTGVVTLPDAFRKVCRSSAVFLDHANSFVPHDLTTWSELSSLRDEYEKNEHRWIPTTGQPVLLPWIIKLVSYKSNRKRKVPFSRHEIYIREGYRCCYCGKRFPTTELNIDHVIPRVQGGQTNWQNCVTSCVPCNTKKAGRTPQQAHMKLLIAPKEPKWTVRHLLPRKINHESWAAFLPDEVISELYWNTQLDNDMEK